MAYGAFNNPIVAALGTLLVNQIQSQDFDPVAQTGWQIKADGTATFFDLNITGGLIIVSGTNQAILIYNGTPQSGNLIGSWAGTAGTDAFGNTYPAGLSVLQGAISGGLITGTTITNSTFSGDVLTGSAISNPSISGGSVTEATITFDTTGGVLLVYASTTTTTSFTTAGLNSFTVPAGVNVARIQVWGADAGAGGGSAARGGEGGGGGEYAEEPAFSLNPGDVCNVFVGSGGTGGVTGFTGSDGDPSIFQTPAGTNVTASGGFAGSGFIGGDGGQGSTATIHHNGGNGGGTGSQGTGGCGGGGRAGSTGAGGNGATSSSSTGAAGGTAGSGTGGHAGGTGGNSGANGNNGGGGGGCGAATSATTGSNSYRLSSSATYYGSDGSLPNQQRSTGTMYQGGETASGGSFNGTQKSLGIISGNPSSDLSGKTIDSVYIRLNQMHSWYNSGANVVLGYNNRTSLPSTWNAADITGVLTFFQSNGVTTTNLTNHGLGSALQSGAAKAITLGPGPSFDLNYYSYYYGAGGDNSLNPLITVNWHTGSSPVTAGNGSDGRIDITYTSGTTLIAAIAPAAGTGPNGNHYPQGVSGIVPGTDWVALQGGGSGNAAINWGTDNASADVGLTRSSTGLIITSGKYISNDTWHDMRPLTNSWVGTISGQYPPQYRLTPDGFVEVVGYVQAPNTGNPNGTTFFTFPSGYFPLSHVISWPITVNLEPSATVLFTCRAEVTTTGTLQVHQCPTTGWASAPVFNIIGRFPLDNSGLITS